MRLFYQDQSKNCLKNTEGEKMEYTLACTYKGMLSKEMCEKIIDAAKAQGEGVDMSKVPQAVSELAKTLKKMGDENAATLHEDYRSLHKWDLPRNEYTEEIYQRVLQYMHLANQEKWKYDIVGIETLQVLRYPTDGHYEWHMDAGSDEDQVNQRKLSMTAYVNAPDIDYEGGELVVDSGQVKMQVKNMKQGSVCFFPSFALHKVNSVTKGERWVLVGWFRGPPLR